MEENNTSMCVQDITDIRMLDAGLFDVLKSEFITSGFKNR